MHEPGEASRPLEASTVPQGSGHKPTASVGSTEPPRTRAKRVLRTVVQVGGFAFGLGLLAWCGMQAFSPENRAQIEKLRTAPAWMPASVAALSMLSLAWNGLIFWAILKPATARAPAPDVVSVNAIAAFLNYLPFKLSVASRFLIHNRRNGIPLATIAAWLAASAVAMMLVLGPLVVASAWRGRLDTLWFISAGAMIAVAAALTCAVTRVLRGERGLALVQHWAARSPVAPGLLSRLARTPTCHHLHSGFAMLSSPRFLALATALRLADVATQAARFVIIGEAVGRTIAWDQATLLSATYFLIGVLSPAGALGMREGGTTWIAKGLDLPDSEVIAVVTLALGAIDALVILTGAAIGVAWLRPDRLLRKRLAEARPAA
ncbi:MAG: lysylphosphatidylglycerol synthase domain-containing protein [Planctomycetota bacterium]|nr:lysylphosphatidylglycerol synthase domain-containing protein [Planctomycetota bacterium]